MSDLTRFPEGVRERAAAFEEQFGILSLPAEQVTVAEIDRLEDELRAEMARIANRAGVSWYLADLETARGGPLEMTELIAADERHFASVVFTLSRGEPVNLYSAQDHRERLRTALGRELVVNGNQVWISAS